MMLLFFSLTENQTTEQVVTEPLIASTATTELPTGTVQQQEAESS